MNLADSLRSDKRRLVAHLEEMNRRARLTQEDEIEFSLVSGGVCGLQYRIDSEESLMRSRDDDESRDYRRAFGDFLRHGWQRSVREEGITEDQRRILLRGDRRDMGAGSTPSGGAAFPGSVSGFFVPAAFSGTVESAMAYHSPMADTATFLTTDRGGPFGFPTDDDISVSGEQIAENTQITQDDVPLGLAMFGAWKYSSRIVKVSIEMLQDTGFDLETYLAGVFARRLARVLNPAFTSGSGSGQPKGILAGITVGATAAGSSLNNGGTGTGATSIGSDDLVALALSVDPAYRKNGGYMMHDSTLAAIQKLKDKQGRPLDIWKPQSINGSFGHINGYGCWPNSDMPQIAANALTVIFGNLSKYVIRKVGEMWIQRLSQRFADVGQVGFIAWYRADGQLLDAGAHPVQALQQAAS